MSKALAIAALVAFVLATFGVSAPFALVPAGLACWVASTLT